MELAAPIIGLGAAAFWIALAAVLIAGGYNRVRREQLRQETLLKLVERTGQLDEQVVKAVCPPPPPLPPHWFAQREHPDGRRALKIFGTIALAGAAGLAIWSLIVLRIGSPDLQYNAELGLAWSALIACLGIGLIVSARFVRPPVDQRDRETS